MTLILTLGKRAALARKALDWFYRWPFRSVTELADSLGIAPSTSSILIISLMEKTFCKSPLANVVEGFTPLGVISGCSLAQESSRKLN